MAYTGKHIDDTISVDASGDVTISGVTGMAIGTGTVATDTLLSFAAGSGSVYLPRVTNAQRPGSPSVGYFHYNTDQGAIEVYDGSWTPLVGTAVSIISAGDSSAAITDTGTGNFTVTVDSASQLVINASSADFQDNLITTTGNITTTGQMGVGGAVNTGRELTVADSAANAYIAIESDGTTGLSGVLFGDSTSDSVSQIVHDNSNNSLIFRTGGSNDRMTIDSSGNVSFSSGVGVTAILDEDTLSSDSATALATQQSIKAYVDNGLSSLSSNSINEGNTNITIADSGTGTITHTVDGSTQLVVNASSADFQDNLITTSGNITTTGQIAVGGAVNTGRELTVTDSAADAYIAIESDGTTGLSGVLFGDSTSDSVSQIVHDNSNDSLIFRTGGSNDRMIIDSSGNIGIGKSPTVPLDIDGGINNNIAVFRSDDSNSYISFRDNTTFSDDAIGVGADGNDFILRSGGNVRMRVGSTGNITPGVTNAQDLGASGTVWATVYATTFDGTATAAQYADLAENYAADQDYTPGTVLIFGGNEEVTMTTVYGNRKVAGVVSEFPAHTMNSALEATHVVTVALTGRVPVKVRGKVRKGDMMVTSGVPGYAESDDNPTVGSVIGKALENFDGDEGTIEVVVGRV